ncbi:MAG TPA: hypothetical protein VIR57_23645 [Chloroflexota bacterium]
MVTAATKFDTANEVLAMEARLISSAAPATGESRIDERLAYALLLLADKEDDALVRLRQAKQSWEYSSHPGYLVAPYLLMLAFQPARVQLAPASILAAVFDAIDGPREYGWQWLTPAGYDTVDEDVGRRATPGLAEILRKHISLRLADDDQRRGWLTTAQALSENAVTEVVGATRRGAYLLVARLAAAYAEAMAITGGRGSDSLEVLRQRYPRHRAFRAELDQAARDSPYLSTPPLQRW